jgi:hypothetical protein
MEHSVEVVDQVHNFLQNKSEIIDCKHGVTPWQWYLHHKGAGF